MNIRNIALAAAAVMAIAAPASADIITIDFDTAQAGYTPTPGVRQNISDDYASLGVVFRDQSSPGFGATVGNCGPGNGANGLALFGHGADFNYCGDTTPNLDVVFVDPNNVNNAATTTFFSIHNFDGLIRASAYDLNNVLLGTTQAYSGDLVLSNIGAIARVNLLSLDQDPTTMDDLQFASVTPVEGGAVPEPAAWALMIGGFGMAGATLRRRRALTA